MYTTNKFEVLCVLTSLLCSCNLVLIPLPVLRMNDASRPLPGMKYTKLRSFTFCVLFRIIYPILIERKIETGIQENVNIYRCSFENRRIFETIHGKSESRHSVSPDRIHLPFDIIATCTIQFHFCSLIGCRIFFTLVSCFSQLTLFSFFKRYSEYGSLYCSLYIPSLLSIPKFQIHTSNLESYNGCKVWVSDIQVRSLP